MSSAGRRLAFAVALVLASLLGVQAAAAATRYASPDGSGANPCAESDPCPFYDAINEAKDGDEVVLLPGTYEESKFAILRAVSVGGRAGAPTPVLKFFGGPLAVENAGATLHDVHIELGDEAMATPLEVFSGTVERVFATNRGPDGKHLGGGACYFHQGLVRDTVCAGLANVDSGEIAGPESVQLVNVDAQPLLLGASEGQHMDIEVLNSIALPDPESGYSIIYDVSQNASASIVISHSAYGKTEDISAGTDLTVRNEANVSAPPLLADPAAGDFRELAGSPTIDAGLASPLAGATDLAGLPRVQPPCPGGAPDIGAYELPSTAPCPAAAAIPISAPAPTPAKVKVGKLKRNLRKGTAILSATVSGPGKLVLTGKGLKKATASPHGVETIKLKLQAKGKALAKLKRTGAVKVKAKLAFTPLGGPAVTAGKKLKLKLRP